MTKKDFTIESNYDNLPLSCVVYEPQKKPVAIFQIVHGMCEYKERYDGFMQFMADNGYVVIAHDHRGHGNSVRKKEDLGYFYDDTGKAIVEDAHQITLYAKEHYKDLPVILFGHSMGSLVVRCYIQKYDGDIDKLIVCGAPSKNALAGAGIFLDNTISLFKGKNHRSGFMQSMTLGSSNDEFESEGKNAWLTRDKAIVEKYNADEKCNFVFTTNGFKNLLILMKNTFKKNLFEVKNPDLPIFFIAGSNDPIIVSDNGFLGSQNTLREVGYKDVKGKLYHEMRHEVLNEIGKEEVYRDILNFCK